MDRRERWRIIRIGVRVIIGVTIIFGALLIPADEWWWVLRAAVQGVGIAQIYIGLRPAVVRYLLVRHTN